MRIILVPAVIALVLLSGCARIAPAEPAEPTAAAETATIEVPSVVGVAGDEARDQLTQLGFVVDFDAVDGPVIMASNWTVDAQIPEAGAQAASGDTITLTVSKPTAETPVVEATTAGLTGAFAQAACDNQAKAEFPFGFDGHWIVGKLADEIVDDQWFFKLTADVKNEYDAEREVTIECLVAGTNDAPVMVSFLAY